jgi:hypothetical protein
MLYAIPFFAAMVDRLYWAIWKERDKRIDPKGGGPGGPLRAWVEAIISGLAGAAGAYVVGRVTGQTDLLSSLAGAYIGGRLVGGAIDSVAQ